MPKIPDFSELTKKFDIQGLLDTVKSAVGGGNAPPAKAPEGDEIATQFVDLIALAHALATVHAEQAKTIGEVHRKLDVLYKQVQTLKLADTNATTVAKTEESAAPAPAADKDKPE